MTDRTCLIVILAAGEGTRMNSARAKVMHAVAGAPMLAHVLQASRSAAPEGRIALVTGPGPGADAVGACAQGLEPGVALFEQRDRLGTAHAVLAARAALEATADDVLVVYGDTPLIRPATLSDIRARLAAGSDVVVLGFRAADPAGYGRLILDAVGGLAAIREDKDASAAEKAVNLCNSGVMAFRGIHLPALIERIGNANAKNEYYLTDAVELAVGDGLTVSVVECCEDEVQGVNSRAGLARAEAAMQARLRAAALVAGVTLVAPETVFLCHDTQLSPDVTVEPNVVFGPGVTVARGATIKAFSHIEGASIGEGVSVGPFARLRPGTKLAAGARVGNFVEIKNADIAEGAKINHLTYVGDAIVGAAANIGAGTITCNYDGFAKHRTVIGAGAFIGSNTALVAPVKVGEGAYVGSGSVITRDVPADALAVGRGQQSEKPGWAKALRDKNAGKKKT